MLSSNLPHSGASQFTTKYYYLSTGSLLGQDEDPAVVGRGRESSCPVNFVEMYFIFYYFNEIAEGLGFCSVGPE